MAKKGLDEDRLKFFKGMGGDQASKSDRSESDKTESRTLESDKPDSEKPESDISESSKAESEISYSDKSESDESEHTKQETVMSESSKSESAKSESDNPESDKEESVNSESDDRRSMHKRKQRASKTTLPKRRVPNVVQKIRARKVDDSIVDQAILAASKSPKVSIYSPFVAAVLKCNELTTIGYKTSADSRELLEKALEQAYPDICEKVRKYIGGDFSPV